MKTKNITDFGLFGVWQNPSRALPGSTFCERLLLFLVRSRGICVTEVTCLTSRQAEKRLYSEFPTKFRVATKHNLMKSFGGQEKLLEFKWGFAPQRKILPLNFRAKNKCSPKIETFGWIFQHYAKLKHNFSFKTKEGFR